MHHFEYKNGELCCEDVPLSRIAEKYGTPCYIYSHATLKRHFEAFDSPFSDASHLTCFSVKSCSNLAVLRLFAGLGGGFDIVSGGELYRVLKAGGDPAKVVYSGVGKTEAEIGFALEQDILMFNVESESELELIETVAGSVNKTARVALRVNPAVDPKTHPYIATGLREAKFGIAMEKVPALYARARDMEHVDPIGVDCHIGSQLTQTAPFVEALMHLVKLFTQLKEEGVNIKYLDIGGGLGISYNKETPPLPHEYAEEILAMAKNLEVTLILEPGRVIVGNAAILLAKVLHVKKTADKSFLIIDAAMNDCIRPALYNAYHEIKSVKEKTQEETPVDVVGPICESGDFLAKARPLPRLDSGDLMAIMSAGAYCSTMASNYNSRPRAPEIMVAGADIHLVRERETWEDLVKNESIPDFLGS